MSPVEETENAYPGAANSDAPAVLRAASSVQEPFQGLSSASACEAKSVNARPMKAAVVVLLIWFSLFQKLVVNAVELA
jgi:hypothetical protein